MWRPAALAFLIVALAGAASPKGPEVNDRPRRSTDLPRPRDGNIAIQEEQDEARRTATVVAYDRFIARHGDHPLVAVARRERARLFSSRPG